MQIPCKKKYIFWCLVLIDLYICLDLIELFVLKIKYVNRLFSQRWLLYTVLVALKIKPVVLVFNKRSLTKSTQFKSSESSKRSLRAVWLSGTVISNPRESRCGITAVPRLPSDLPHPSSHLPLQASLVQPVILPSPQPLSAFVCTCN